MSAPADDRSPRRDVPPPPSSSPDPRGAGGAANNTLDGRMVRGNDSKRVYVGNVSHTANEEDLKQHFSKYFPVLCSLNPKGFAFIEFEEERDAQDAMRYMNGVEHMGRRLSVRPAGSQGQGRGGPREFGRDRYDRFDGPPRGNSRMGPGVALGYRLTVENVSDKTSWQDLKDFGRRGGESIKYADVFNGPAGKTGVISYASKEEADNAIRVLDGQDLHGNVVRVTEDRNPEPPRHEPQRGGYDRDYRGGAPAYRGGGGGGFRHDDRPSYDRPYDDRYAPRGPYGYDDRRGPPPPPADYGRGTGGYYDAQPRGGYDDRYGRAPPPAHDYYRGPPPPAAYDDRSRGGRRTPSPQRAAARPAGGRSRSRSRERSRSRSRGRNNDKPAAAARSRSRSPQRRRTPSPDRRR